MILIKDDDEPVETELDENALVKSNKYYRRIEFLGFSKIWKKIMNVTSLAQLTLFNRGVNSLGEHNEIQKLFPNVTQLSLEINLLNSWEKVFGLAEELPDLNILDLNFNHYAFKTEQIQNLNDFNEITSGPSNIK